MFERVDLKSILFQTGQPFFNRSEQGGEVKLMMNRRILRKVRACEFEERG